ncbi:MAG TPA: hypothetical protein VMG37_05010 [Solirubrobacteraceae bacterium]|nr:hypothetical protein [Solirubrobacteraceae bacterium]
MSGYRSEINASAGPSRIGRVGGGALLLVRVRLFDCGGEDPQPDAYTDLLPRDARRLALELLAAAENAERQTEQAGFWKQAR